MSTSLNEMFPGADEEVVVRTSDLHEASECLDEAAEALMSWIQEKMREQGFSSFDEANEGSHLLSRALYVVDLLETADHIVSKYANRALAAEPV